MSTVTTAQRKATALVSGTDAAYALLAHFLVPGNMADPLGSRADPWCRREISTVNAGLLYSAVRLYRGHRDIGFLWTTEVSALVMTAVRAVAARRGQCRGAAFPLVLATKVVLGGGALLLADEETELGA